MEKIKVEIDIDSGLSIFCVVLKQQYMDVSIVEEGFFSFDKEENEREFDKLKEAYRLVMEFNGIDVDNGVEL